MAKVASLEAQNSQLRMAAARREQVLQQSKRFIEEHLARWSPSGGPGAAAAAAAAAAAPGSGGGGGGSGAPGGGYGQRGVDGNGSG
jgi:hypothetical protein